MPLTLPFCILALRRPLPLQSMYDEYRKVTEAEKADVVGLGGLHVVGTGECCVQLVVV